MTSTRDALLRAVCADPADDTARLVLADWYEENGEPDRGEFVRVQVELATMQPCVSSGNWIKCVEMPSECRYCCLRRREVDLWTDYKFCGRLEGEKLSGTCPWANAVDLRKTRLGIGTFAAVSCGFVSSIRCELAFWIGGRCRCYTPYGSGTIITGRNGGTVETCPDCGSTLGRTPAHGPRIVAEQPVQEVRTERTPSRNSSNGNYGWFRWGNMEENLDTVPEEIFDMMKAVHQFPPSEMKQPASLRQMYWDSPELAQSALSLALVNWARREAGLPPLEERR